MPNKKPRKKDTSNLRISTLKSNVKKLPNSNILKKIHDIQVFIDHNQKKLNSLIKEQKIIVSKLNQAKSDLKNIQTKHKKLLGGSKKLIKNPTK